MSTVFAEPEVLVMTMSWSDFGLPVLLNDAVGAPDRVTVNVAAWAAGAHRTNVDRSAASMPAMATAEMVRSRAIVDVFMAILRSLGGAGCCFKRDLRGYRAIPP